MAKSASVTQGLAAVLLLCVSGAAAAEDLLDVYRLALDHDPVLQGAQAARQAAFEAKPQSRALLFPTINFNAGVQRDRQDVIKSTLFGATGTFNFDVTTYTLALDQPLYHRDYLARLHQADASVAQADAQFRSVEQGLMLRVAGVYFDILAAQDTLEFAQAEKNAIERQLEQTRQRFDVGLIAITDVHEAQAAFDLARAQEIDARNQLDNAEEALREITGQLVDRTAPLTGDLPLVQPTPTDIDAWTKTALDQNFDLLAAQFAVDVARQEVQVQRAGHFPQLDAQASLARSDTGGGSFGERTIEDAIVGLQLSVPIFQGGLVRSRVRQADFQLAQARQSLEGQRRATLRAAREAYLSVDAAINRVAALKQAQVSAQSALEATQAGFEVGTRTTVDVLNARRELFGARRDYARARYDYILSTLRLKQAAGTLAFEDLQGVNRWLQEQGTTGKTESGKDSVAP